MSGAREKFRIGVYVLAKYAKQTYAKECYDVRINAGMAVTCDILRRAGFDNISYCSAANVTSFDMIMFSVTSDCDWWPFVSERVKWPKGTYKVVVGGAGVLNPRPFLDIVDYFVLGRAEGVQPLVAQAIMAGSPLRNEHVVESKAFSLDRNYVINQTNEIYPHDIPLPNGSVYHEDIIGCNHKCLFCGYTWQRKPVQDSAFQYSGLWNGGADRERAMIDLDQGEPVDLNKLRTTSIDGFSERLRYRVNKRISREMLQRFLERIALCDKPHQVKIYNICGYPTETQDDWFEFLDDIRQVDRRLAPTSRQTSILLHSTPFRPMPATPMACEPMAYVNFRGLISKTLGKGRYRGNIFYQGNSMWAVESMGTESLAAVAQSAIIWRGTENDFGNIAMVAKSTKFAGASSAVKIKTLENMFDLPQLFGAFTRETLPTRNIRTYLPIENAWPRRCQNAGSETTYGCHNRKWAQTSE